MVLSRDIGHHILRKHETDLFKDKDNVKTLYKDKYLKEPIILSVGTDAYHFCFADNSCIRRQDVALTHFQGKTDKHREALIKLREKYPLDGSVTQEPQRQYLSEDETTSLQHIFAQVVVADTIGFSRKDKAVLTKLGIFVEPEKIKEMFPHLYPDEPEEEEETPQDEEQQEEPPPPPETLEEEEEQTIEVLDNRKIDRRPQQKT